jgi:N-acetylglucosamine-6-phosphate deacetylase
MRAPTLRELERLQRAARGRIRLLTLAPELRGADDAIRWCRRRSIVVSLGHTDARAKEARHAVRIGARAVTHLFNGMRPFHHRDPGLLDVALTDPRLTTMVIADGVHVSPSALRLLLRTKAPEQVALVTDSIAHQGWDVVKQQGAYYTRRGVLAGSCLTMMEAVRNAVRLGGAPLEAAVRMGSETPATVLSLQRSRGELAVGKRADLVVFNNRCEVSMTIVNGKLVYQGESSL